MSDKENNVTEAVSKGSFDWSWAAWVLPVLALVMAGWLVLRTVPDSAGTVIISLQDADGIQANSTQLINRGVVIGIVSDVVLASDNSHVELSVVLNEGREDFTREGAKYWIVRPELNNASLQGLSTIVSGAEIHAEPGSGTLIQRFELTTPTPLEGVDTDDLQITLLAPIKSGLNRGSNVSYRGMKTGVISAVELAEDATGVHIEVNIFKDFAHLVRSDSVFWNSGGINVEFGLFSGADVNVGSISSLFAGEVSFATPEELNAPAENGNSFVLADEADDDWLEWQPEITR